MTERKKLVNKLDKLVREIVLKRDENKCQWCDKYVEGKNAHVSHVFAKKRHGHLRWNLNNVKLLCFNCHRHRWHDDHVASGAMEWFKNKYPDRYKYLIENKENNIKFTIPMLRDLVDSLSSL